MIKSGGDGAEIQVQEPKVLTDTSEYSGTSFYTLIH